MDLIWLIPLLPGLGAALNGLVGIRFFSKQTAGLVAVSTMAVAFVLSVVAFLGLLGLPEDERYHEVTVASWIPPIPLETANGIGSFEVPWAFALDPLSGMMLLVVTGIGLLIHVYSVGYIAHEPRGGVARFFCYLNLFCFFMLTLVLGSSFLVMFVGWEGVGLCSYLLIGYWYRKQSASDAGKKAFIVNRIGDWGFILGIFLVFFTFGTLDFREVAVAAAAMPVEVGFGVLSLICLFLFIGATGKSAQIPLYVWLPDAMEGPTPVSALIHAATMVTAGVYMVCRNAVLFSHAPMVMEVVAWIGVLTAFMAATIGLVQTDIKRVLAYSTVSQLGFMFLGAGVGAFTASIFHLMTHAFFKALLFLGAGAVIHSMHHALHKSGSHEDAQDMRNMGGLRTRMRITWVVMWIATLAIAGIWPFAGFFSKDEIIWYTAAWAGAESNPYGWLYTVYWLVALATALLTAFYMTRLMIMTFHGSSRVEQGARGYLHEAPRVMTVPLMVLAVLSVFGGWVNVPEELQASVVGFFGALPMSEWLHHWLEPVTESAGAVQVAAMGDPSYSAPLVGGGEVMWALLSTLAAAAVVAGSCRYLLARKYVPAAEAAAPSSGLGRILYNKWYFDEIFDRGVVQPILSASRWCWKVVDTVLIDGFVNFVGNFTRLAGWIASLFQTGQATTYAFVLTLGVLAILGAAVFLQ